MQLAELLQPWVSLPLSGCDIVNLQNDSRKIKPGDLFLAYPGALADGRAFIPQAIAAGAKAIAYDPQSFDTVLSEGEVPFIPIAHLGSHLAAVASRFYNNPSQFLSITGITGTNGKTSIAYQLAQAFELLGRPSAYIGTLGQGSVRDLQPLANTTPDGLCLQQLLHENCIRGVQEVCMEVSSHALAQRRVNNVSFSGAIFTNLSHEHLDYHGTMENYAAAKAQLFSLSSLRFAILNQDDEYSAMMAAQLTEDCRTFTYGLSDAASVQGLHWQSSIEGSTLEVKTPWGHMDLALSCIGEFNIYNSLAVVATLLAHGVPLKETSSVMREIHAAPGRMEVITQRPHVIVDYAHTPDALQNVLQTLARLKKGLLWVVFGCGGDRDKEKRPMMGKIASHHADRIIITSDNPRSEDPKKIMDDIAVGLAPGTQALQVMDRRAAIEQALRLAGKQDIILIAGKGHESYQETEKKRYYFADQEVVRRFYGML